MISPVAGAPLRRGAAAPFHYTPMIGMRECLLNYTPLPKDLCNMVIEYYDNLPSMIVTAIPINDKPEWKTVASGWVHRLADRAHNMLMYGQRVSMLVSIRGDTVQYITIDTVDHFWVVEDAIIAIGLGRFTSYTTAKGWSRITQLPDPQYFPTSPLVEPISNYGVVCRDTIYGRIQSPLKGRKLVEIISIKESAPVVKDIYALLDRRNKSLILPHYCTIADHDENRIYFISDTSHNCEYFVIDSRTGESKSYPMKPIPRFNPSKSISSSEAECYSRVISAVVCKGIVTVLRNGRIDTWDPATDCWSTQWITQVFPDDTRHILCVGG